MGVIRLFSSCSADNLAPEPIRRSQPASTALPNPDPRNFEIKNVLKSGRFLIVEVLYPDCTNFEGDKILVFKNLSEKRLRSLTVLDPHFCDSKTHPSPVARFAPTTVGWRYAKRFCEAASLKK